MAENHSTLTRVPIELLFVEDPSFAVIKVSRAGVTDLWDAQSRLYAGKSILGLRSHLRLMRAFVNPDRADFSDFRAWWDLQFSITGNRPPMSADERILDRHEYFVHLASRLGDSRADDDVFTVDAEYDSQTGRFVLKDGHHRACFLVALGFRYVTVRTSTSSLAAFTNLTAARDVCDLLRRQNTNQHYQPVEHPLLPVMLTHRDITSPNRLHVIADTLGYFHPTSVLDIGSNIGYFSRHFAREGARVVAVEPNASYADLASSLDALYNTTVHINRVAVESFQPGQQTFEMCLLLTVFYHFMPIKSIADRILQLLDSNVERFVFWESGDSAPIEIDMIRNATGFRHYARLWATIGTRKFRELGVFARTRADLDLVCDTNQFHKLLSISKSSRDLSALPLR